MLTPHIAQALAFDPRRVVIVGASGWLGLATLELLEQALGDTFADRVCCFGSAARDLVLRSGRRVRQQPLAAMAGLAPGPALVLHYAFLTKDRAEAMDEPAYVAANHAIAEGVLAGLDALGSASLFIASSGAAMKAHDPQASPAMRLYGRLKREDEDRFAAWASAPARRVVIGRIFNITGPYINKHGAYAIANFMIDAMAGRPVVVKAPRAVIRSYVAIRELVSLVFALLLADGDGVVRFDSGGDRLELGAVAGAVAAVIAPGLPVERAPLTEAVADVYHGDCAAYAQLLEDRGIATVTLDMQIAEMRDYFLHLAAIA